MWFISAWTLISNLFHEFNKHLLQRKSQYLHQGHNNASSGFELATFQLLTENLSQSCSTSNFFSPCLFVICQKNVSVTFLCDCDFMHSFYIFSSSVSVSPPLSSFSTPLPCCLPPSQPAHRFFRACCFLYLPSQGPGSSDAQAAQVPVPCTRRQERFETFSTLPTGLVMFSTF